MSPEQLMTEGNTKWYQSLASHEDTTRGLKKSLVCITELQRVKDWVTPISWFVVTGYYPNGTKYQRKYWSLDQACVEYDLLYTRMVRSQTMPKRLMLS